MRLLICADTVSNGGAGRINQLLARGLRRRGLEVILIEPPERPVGAAPLPPIPLARALEAHDPALVLFACGGPHSLLTEREAAAAHRIPFLTLIHQVDERWASLSSQPRLARLFAASREVVAVSEHNLSLLRDCFGLQPGHGRVILNALPDSFFAPIPLSPRQAILQEFGFPPDVVLVVAAARVELAKGPHHLLEIVRSLPAGGEGEAERIRFVWAGEGTRRAQLTALTRMLGQADRLRFIGPRADVVGLLASADLAVLPSEAEGMPLAVLEAMALGVPVIATAAGGIAEALADTGVVAGDLRADPSGTRERFRAALLRLAQDGGERRRLGDRARTRAAHLFREDRMVTDYLNVLQRAALA